MPFLIEQESGIAFSRDRHTVELTLLAGGRIKVIFLNLED